MANTKKMTKRDYFNQLKEKYPLTQDEIKFVDNELKLLEKKNSAERKPTAQQKANETLKEAILKNIKSNVQYTITAIIKTVPECSELTNQKVSAVVRQMVEKGSLIRTEEKGKAYFTKS